jgi:hypothetical protein
VVHEALVLSRSKQLFEFLLDGNHPLHVFRTRQAFLAELGVLEMHSIDRIKAHGIPDS